METEELNAEFSVFYEQKKLRKIINLTCIPVIIQSLGNYVLTFIIGYLFYSISLMLKISHNEYSSFIDQINDRTSTASLMINLLFYILLIFVPFLLYFLFRKQKISENISFKLPKIRGFIYGIFISMGFSYLGNIITAIILNILNKTPYPPKPIDFPSPDGQLNIIIFFISIAILPPLLEEFAYRGVIMGQTKSYSFGFAIIYSSIMFSLMHCTIQQIPFAFMVGLSIAYFTLKYNSIWIGVAIHFVNNASSIVLQLLKDKANFIFYLFFANFYVIIIFFGFIISLILFLVLEGVKINQDKRALPLRNCLVALFTSPLFYVTVIILIVKTAINYGLSF